MSMADVQDQNGRFGLVTPESVKSLLETCVGQNVLFLSVVRRIQRLLGSELLRDAPRVVQIETELEIDALQLEIATSVYGQVDPNRDEPQETNARFREVVEAGVLPMPRQIQYVRGLHDRITALYQALPNAQSSPEESWGEAWLYDQIHQVEYFRDRIPAETDNLHLDAEAATMLQSGLEFWMRHADELIPEQVDLVKYVQDLLGKVTQVENAAETTSLELVKPDKKDKNDWKDWRIPPHEVNVNFHGGGGTYRGEWLDSPVDVRKVIDSDDAFFKRAAGLWIKLAHPNIVNLLAVVCEDGEQQYFVTEPGEQGNLIKYLRNHPGKLWQKLHEVALALEYLHERGIVHAQVKPDCIRVGRAGTAKLTGFECSMTIQELERVDSIPVRRDFRWHAPERFGGSKPSFASDVFSLASCIIVAVSEEPPYGRALSDLEAREQMEQHIMPPRPAIFSDEQWRLVVEMYEFDPSNRIQMSEVVTRLAGFADEVHAGSSVLASEECGDAGGALQLQCDVSGAWFDVPFGVKSDTRCSRVESVAPPQTLEHRTQPTVCTIHPWTILQHELYYDEREHRGSTEHTLRYMGKWLGSEVVLASVRGDFDGMSDAIDRIAEICFALKHPHLQQLYGVAIVGHHKLFVCEYPEKGNLSSFLLKHPDQVWQKLLEVALALRYLHHHGVVYGDLNCHVVLVDSAGRAKLGTIECCLKAKCKSKSYNAR